MSKLSIGILYTTATTPDYLRRCYEWGYPELLTPGKRSSKYDVVIIPDGISAYVGMQCFQGRYEPIGLRPMDNMAELFRTHERGLKYYAENSLVIGVGEGMTMLWDFLGFKAVVTGPESKIRLIRPEDEVLVTYKSQDLFVDSWKYNNFVGVEGMWDTIFRNTMNEHANSLEDFIQNFKSHKAQSGFRPLKNI
jgi:hypothetical protein